MAPWVSRGPEAENSDNAPKGYPGGDDAARGVVHVRCGPTFDRDQMANIALPSPDKSRSALRSPGSSKRRFTRCRCCLWQLRSSCGRYWHPPWGTRRSTSSWCRRSSLPVSWEDGDRASWPRSLSLIVHLYATGEGSNLIHPSEPLFAAELTRAATFVALGIGICLVRRAPAHDPPRAPLRARPI